MLSGNALRAVLAGFAALSGTALFAQVPTLTGVANAALASASLAPGSLVDVTGTGFPSPTPAQLNNCAAQPQYCAQVGNFFAQVVSSNSTRWRILIPPSISPGPTTISIGNSNSVNVTLQQYAPTFFSLDLSGAGVVSGQGFMNADTSGQGYQIGNPQAAQLGDVLYLNLTGLGPVDPSNEFDTLTLPTVTVGGTPVDVFAAYLANAVLDDCVGQQCVAGMYQVGIVLPPAMPLTGQPMPLAMTIGGVTSQAQITLPIGSSPVIAAVLNGASWDGSFISPGSLATVFGTTFGSTDVSAPCMTWPATPCMSLGGISVTFNGTAAQLVYAGTAVNDSYGQVNLVVPPGLPTSGAVNVVVNTAAGASSAFPVQMASAAPGVFFWSWQTAPNQQVRVAAAGVHGKSWLVMPGGLAQAFGIQGSCRAGNVPSATLCAEPAKAGDSIDIYVTGLGATTATGATTVLPTVMIGGAPASVSFSGLIPGYTGLYWITAQIPASAQPGLAVPLVVSTSNGNSDGKSTIAISQ